MLLACTHVLTHLCTVSRCAFNFFSPALCIMTRLMLNPSQFLKRDKLFEHGQLNLILYLLYFLRKTSNVPVFFI